MNGTAGGKVAIVSGGGRGIGRSHALSLAREGAAVLDNDLGARFHRLRVACDNATGAKRAYGQRGDRRRCAGQE